MKLKEVSVKELFGIYDYTIPINTNEGITIIHAPNGYGKSTILKLLSYILNGNISKIASKKFKEFNIEFDNSTVLKVIKESNKYSIKKDDFYSSISNKNLYILFEGLKFKIVSSNGEICEYNPICKADVQEIINTVDNKLPFLKRVDSLTWMDLDGNNKFGLHELIEKYGHALSLLEYKTEENAAMNEIRKQIEIKYIGADRLFTKIKDYTVDDIFYDGNNKLIPTLRVLSNKVKEIIEEHIERYTKVSQRLENSFPQRLFDMINNTDDAKKLSKEDIQTKLDELSVLKSELSKYGLLFEEDSKTNYIPDTNDLIKDVISLYINDTKEKLEVYRTLKKKFDLLLNFINKRFVNKRMSINKKNGFVITSEDGEVLNPLTLSSGEQHELVLYYEILFNTKDNTLIIIDEPEISLHIGWQREFISDLKNILNLINNYFIIATHSPDIINDYWELTAGLGEE